MDANNIMNLKRILIFVRGLRSQIQPKLCTYIIYTLQHSIRLVMQIDAIKRIDEVLIKQLLNSMKVPKNIPMSSPIV